MNSDITVTVDTTNLEMALAEAHRQLRRPRWPWMMHCWYAFIAGFIVAGVIFITMAHYSRCVFIDPSTEINDNQLYG